MIPRRVLKPLVLAVLFLPLLYLLLGVGPGVLWGELGLMAAGRFAKGSAVTDAAVPLATPSGAVVNEEVPVGNPIDMEDRGACSTYFSYLERFVKFPIHPLDRSYDPLILDRQKYIETRYEKVLSRFTRKNPKDTGMAPAELSKLTQRSEKMLREFVAAEHEAKTAKNALLEQEAVEKIQRLRRFNLCFLPASGVSSACPVEEKLFPALTREWPVYERWDGSLFANGVIPVISRKEGVVTVSKKTMDAKGCFVSSLRASFEGRGIVVSASDRHLQELKGLISVLGVLGNTLPIQVVYRNDLSPQTKADLVRVARNFKPASDPSSDETEKENPSALGGTAHAVGEPQELWFVDITISLTSSRTYLKLLLGFSNKILAYLFASFRETILMDTDTVPLVRPEEWFDHSVYNKTSTLFFRDRQIDEKAPVAAVRFFRATLMAAIELDDNTQFGIPTLTSHTRQNGLFGDGEAHTMESGVVVIDRVMHFPGVLMAFQLMQLAPVKVLSWGDKELFWLALAASGDENYGFNEHRAAAVGEMVDTAAASLAGSHPVALSRRVCSTHPGHISSDNGRLQWINSGFSFCKINDWKADRKLPFFLGFSDEQISELYGTPFKLTAAVIPPLHLKMRAAGVMVKAAYVDPEAKPIERAWANDPSVCRGYLWCAQGEVYGVKGDVWEFPKLEVERFAAIGRVWYDAISDTSREAPTKKT